MKSLRLCLLATASSVVLIGSASAQPPVPMAMTWAGPYAGLNLGGAWNSAKFSDLNAGNGTYQFPLGTNDPFWSPSAAGFTFGGQAGYNWQTGKFVYGVEGDLNWANAKATSTFAPLGGVPNTVTASTKMDWMATVRGRLGVTYNQFLLYGTGGVAFAHFSDSWGLIALGGNELASSQTRTGWTGGGGVEYMFGPHWTARVEALYANFGNTTITPNIPGAGVYSSRFQHSMSTVRGALNWKW